MGVVQELRAMDNLTAAERQIRDFILEHPEELFSLNVQQIGERSFTSAAAVTRLCKKLGFSGFKDFRVQFVAETGEQIRGGGQERPAARMEQREGMASILAKMTEVYRQALEQTVRDNPLETLIRASTLIHSAQMLDFYCTDLNRTLAQYAAYVFAGAGKRTQVFDDRFVMLHEALLSPEGTLSVVISFTGKNAQLLQVCQSLHRRGRRIILITRNREHPMCAYADVVLLLASSDPHGDVEQTEDFYTGFYIERYSTSLKFLLDALANVEHNRDMEGSRALAGQYLRMGEALERGQGKPGR